MSFNIAWNNSLIFYSYYVCYYIHMCLCKCASIAHTHTHVHVKHFVHNYIRVQITLTTITTNPTALSSCILLQHIRQPLWCSICIPTISLYSFDSSLYLKNDVGSCVVKYIECMPYCMQDNITHTFILSSYNFCP